MRAKEWVDIMATNTWVVIVLELAIWFLIPMAFWIKMMAVGIGLGFLIGKGSALDQDNDPDPRQPHDCWDDRDDCWTDEEIIS